MTRPSSACGRAAGETRAEDEKRNKEEARCSFYHRSVDAQSARQTNLNAALEGRHGRTFVHTLA